MFMEVFSNTRANQMRVGITWNLIAYKYQIAMVMIANIKDLNHNLNNINTRNLLIEIL